MKRFGTACLRAAFAVALLAMPAAGEASTTLVGQVTCSSCWSEADRNVVPYGGEADAACAARCAKAGVPPAIATRQDDGKYRLSNIDGPPPAPHESWLGLIAAFVRAESVPASDGAIRVTALERLDASPWPAAAAEHPDTLRWRDLTGTEQSIADLRGRVVVVNFWATWCKPCVEEMPVLSAIQSDYAPLGVQVVGIAADARDASAGVLEFARKTGVTFPLWLGATTRDMASFEVGPALPATVVIDRDGHVVHRVHGVVEGPELRNVLDRVVGGAATAKAAGPRDAPDRVARAPKEAALVPS